MGRNNCRKLGEKCEAEKETKLSALLLPEVFERAGNSINQYLQSDSYEDDKRSRLAIITTIQNLLEKAGFLMKPKDNDIKCLDPIDHTSLPFSLKRELSVVEDTHLRNAPRGPPRLPSAQGSAAGVRWFQTMVQGNWKSGGPLVSAPKSKAALKPKRIGWLLSLGVGITKVLKRV